jgi:hypothetical protein
MSETIVNNTGRRCVTITQIKQGAPVSSFTFMPGINFVSEEMLNSCKADLELHFKEGTFKIEHKKKVESKEGKDGKKEKVLASKEFKDLTAEECEAIIKKTYDRAKLNKLKKAETRDSVRVALQNQIEDLEKFRRKHLEEDKD